MKIALYGRTFTRDYLCTLNEFIGDLQTSGIEIFVFRPLWTEIKDCFTGQQPNGFFETHEELKHCADFIFSIGGDGTLLGVLPLVRNSGIPVLGINTGRMGFLSSIARNEVNEAIKKLLNGQFQIEQRSLIQLIDPNKMFDEINYALNEVSVFRKSDNSLMVIKVFVNNVLLNTYWSDGLIVATPTGSTAYSLSAGGPIVAPNSQSFIITPVAPHNLSVRPVVLPDDCTIKIKVESRSDYCILNMDSRSLTIKTDTEVSFRKADFALNMVNLEGKDFFKTIREKLLWGIDIRN